MFGSLYRHENGPFPGTIARHLRERCSMKQRPCLTFLVVCICMLLAAGCGSKSHTPSSPAQSPGDALYAQGTDAFSKNDFTAAADLFKLAQENYTAAGDRIPALKARDMAFLAFCAAGDFPYNRSAIEAELAAAFPDMAAAERIALLDGDSRTATIRRGDEILYFYDTVHNIKNHYPAILRKENERNQYTPLYDELMPLINTPWKEGAGPYGNPVAFTGSVELAIPRGELPPDGTLKLWIPLPIETASQTNVTIISVEPARYVKSATGTRADLGLAYLEIPLAEMKEPSVNVTARFRFVGHEQRFVIDPATVTPCNTASPEYLKYTGSSRNIAITPEMKAKALSMVGTETNPYLQAQKIYWDIVSTHPYSHAPHSWLDATRTPESLYVLKTGIGDCGSQSIYFTALCRSIGIPARASGGYQMIQGHAGTHFWAEFYLEGYGWIPVDVTAAEGGDASYNATPEELHRYKAYYFGSLDPYRYFIQKDVDLPLTPDAGDAVTSPYGWVQFPKAACDTCIDNPMILAITYSKTTVKKE